MLKTTIAEVTFCDDGIDEHPFPSLNLSDYVKEKHITDNVHPIVEISRTYLMLRSNYPSK